MHRAKYGEGVQGSHVKGGSWQLELHATPALPGEAVCPLCLCGGPGLFLPPGSLWDWGKGWSKDLWKHLLKDLEYSVLGL